MGKKSRRWLIALVLAILALQALATIVPNRTSISVKSPEGDYEIESTGRGPQRVRLDLGDGSFVESGAR
jgi:hypothetical protein